MLVRETLLAFPLPRALMALLGLASVPSSQVVAQTAPQQYVYDSVPLTTTSSNITGYAKNAQTDALAAVPGSPFAERPQGSSMAIDARGRFLFVVNRITNNISMFQIDSATGSLTEVPSSPFSMTSL
jgi:Lactonase, 7-bladed beta-propeller